MNVLFTSNGAELWGAERSLLELAGGVRNEGIRPHLACPPDGPLAGAAAEMGIPIYPIPTPTFRRRDRLRPRLKTTIAWGRACARLGVLLRRSRFDLVHANTTMALTWTAPVAALSRIPCVWQWRDFHALGIANRALARLATLSIAVSDAAFQFAAQELGTTERLLMIQQGVGDFAREGLGGAREAWRTSRSIGSDEIVVLLLGQPIRRKGHETFVRALASARGSSTSVRGVIAPGLPECDPSGHLTSMVDLHHALGGKGLILEPRTNDVRTLLEAVDILAVPSLREPFGRTAVEGMLAQLPVVGSDVDGLASIVARGETGFLVPPGDSEALAEAIVRLARDPSLRSRMGEAGRQRALRSFSLASTVRQTVDVYQAVLSDRS